MSGSVLRPGPVADDKDGGMSENVPTSVCLSFGEACAARPVKLRRLLPSQDSEITPKQACRQAPEIGLKFARQIRWS